MKNERGAILAITAISLLALMGALILVVDLGHVVAERGKAQAAADALALAASTENCVTRTHVPLSGLVEGNWPGASYAVTGGKTWTTKGGLDRHCRVEVTVWQDVPTFFASLIGIDSVRVEQYAAAEWYGPKQKLRGPPPEAYTIRLVA